MAHYDGHNIQSRTEDSGQAKLEANRPLPTETVENDKEGLQAPPSSRSGKFTATEGHAKAEVEKDTSQYKWCKCYFEAPPGTQDFYFMNFDTRETKYEEPNEPYWIWDAMTQNVHPSGLQLSSKSPPASLSSKYEGYNPKIHGNYDPNAPYAQYHNRQDETEVGIADAPRSDSAAASLDSGATAYREVGAFNRFTGSFQTADKSSERHDDYNKSGRQLNAFFDVDAAANAHDGRSLKEERRSQKLSKKDIQEMTKKRREKKEKKRMDFYKT